MILTTSQIWKTLEVALVSLLILKIALIAYSFSLVSSQVEQRESFDLVNRSNLTYYLQVNDPQTIILCYSNPTQDFVQLSSLLPDFYSHSYKSIYLDLPYQSQKFVDSYISGETTWEEVIASNAYAMAPYSDGSDLFNSRPLIDAAKELTLTTILMNNQFTGSNRFLTYPVIPKEYDLDNFMYEYWQTTDRQNTKSIIITSIGHCTENPALLFGSFYTINEGGGFSAVNRPESEITDQIYYIKNNGYGTESLANKVFDSSPQQNAIKVLIFPFEQENTNTIPFSSNNITVDYLSIKPD